MTLTIAVISGRPDNDTILPKREKYVWGELKRILKEDMQKFKGQDVQFFIPIYNKFDLEILRICEQMELPVVYYIPNEQWGTEKLPKHQLDLIARMRKETRIIAGDFKDRLIRMIRDADLVYILPKTKGVDEFAHELVDKKFYLVPIGKMMYTTEAEAETMIAERLQHEAPSPDELSRLMDEVEVKHLLT